MNEYLNQRTFNKIKYTFLDFFLVLFLGEKPLKAMSEVIPISRHM